MNIKDFKNVHAGEKVFLLGNGPSLANVYDRLPELSKRGWTIGMNRSWMPPLDGSMSFFADYHCFVNASHAVDILNGSNVPRLATFCLQGPGCENFITMRQIDGASHNSFRYDLEHGTDAPFAGLFALKLAFYMGFSEVWLLGYDACDKGHHCDSLETGRRGHAPWFAGAFQWQKQRGDISIFNASPESEITYFEKRQP